MQMLQRLLQCLLPKSSINSILTLADLAAYRAIVPNAVMFCFRYNIYCGKKHNEKQGEY